MSERSELALESELVNGEEGELPYRLPLELTVEDHETIAALCALPAGEEREQFALNALRIGVLALRQARGHVDAERIRRESELLLKSLERQLGTHAGVVQERIAAALKEYFDPESGRFQERVNRLLKKDGELEDVLRRQVGADDSELCRTLAAHVGRESPLFKLLSPAESEGLMAALRATLEGQLGEQRSRILDQFSLDNKEGALSRLVLELTASHETLTEGLQGKIDEVVRQFSLNEEDSALSRLVRNVERAQKTITGEFSLDSETSALSRLKRMLESTQQAIDSNLTLDKEDSALARLRKEVLTILEHHGKANAEFQEQVKIALRTMVAQREEAERSTRHGIAFEAAVCAFVEHESQKAGDVATPTGETTGLISHCKIGDCVVELGADSAAPGAAIVVEAKEKEGYPLQKALQEVDTARQNRGAQVGVFVYSKRLAPEGLDPLKRHGNDVVVVWDAEDTASDVYLKAALTLARALCIRAAKASDAREADFQAIDEAILEIQKRADNLGEIDRLAKTIYKNSEGILDRVRIDREAVSKQLQILRDRLADLRHLLAENASGT